MSLSAAQLLTIMEALKAKCAAAGSNIDYFIPTPFKFGSKAGFFNVLDPQTTQTDIETTLIKALWIDCLRFEDYDPESDCTGKTLYFELTLFHEEDETRVDEADAFETQILQSSFQHTADIYALCGEFQGTNELNIAGFAVSEYTSLSQNDFTQRSVECDFITNGAVGSQSKLQTKVRISEV